MTLDPRIQALLINLADSSERLAQSRCILDKADLRAERFDAVDGRTCLPTDVPGYDDITATRTIGRSLRPGEIGCFLSHRSALRSFLETDQPALLLLEDDLTVASDLAMICNDTLNWLNANAPNWRAVHLASTYDKYSRKITDVAGCDLKRAYAFPLFTTAILWSRRGAEEALKALERISAPIDNAFRLHLSGTAEAYQIVPPPVGRRDGPSDIDRIEDRLSEHANGTVHRDRWQVYRRVVQGVVRDFCRQRA